MLSRLARMAGAAVLILALTAPIAEAATPSAFVYATGSASSVYQFAADDAGLLSTLTPASIPGAGAATGTATSPDGRNLYVVTQGANQVAHYRIGDDGTLSAQEIVATGNGPFGIAVAPDGRHAYVADQNDNAVSVYDIGPDGALTAHPDLVAARGGAIEVALTPDGTSAYVTNFSDGTISQYDVGADGSLSPKPTPFVSAGTSPIGIAVSSDGDSVYAVNRTVSGTVRQYTVGSDGSLAAMSPATVDAGSRPVGIAVGSDGAYVTNYNDHSISSYGVGPDGALEAMTPATVDAPDNPFGIAIAPDGDSVYVASFEAGAVAQYDVAGGGGLVAKSPASVVSGSSLVALSVVRAPDLAAPTIDLRTPDEGTQYTVGDDVRADYSCDDEGGSGLASCTGDVPDGDAIDTSTAGDHAFTVTARDGAGHESTVTHRYTVVERGRDEQPPTVDLRTPDEGAAYDVDEVVAADYSCADTGGSGLQSCTGTVDDGAAIDTSTAGDHTFTVVARDGEGNETTVSHTYTVDASTGFKFVGPIHDGSVVRAGSVVTIRFSLGGYQGNHVLADGSPSSVSVDCDDPGEPTGGRPAASDSGLRYDWRSGAYSFAWQTQRSWAKTCRAFVVTLRDGSVHRLVLSFRSSYEDYHHSYRRWRH